MQTRDGMTPDGVDRELELVDKDRSKLVTSDVTGETRHLKRTAGGHGRWALPNQSCLKKGTVRTSTARFGGFDPGRAEGDPSMLAGFRVSRPTSLTHRKTCERRLRVLAESCQGFRLKGV